MDNIPPHDFLLGEDRRHVSGRVARVVGIKHTPRAPDIITLRDRLKRTYQFLPHSYAGREWAKMTWTRRIRLKEKREENPGG